MNVMGVPGCRGLGFLEFSTRRLVVDGDSHVRWGVHSELRMAALSIVVDLEVFEQRVGELDAGLPAFGAEQLDLKSRPECFDHCVVVAISDRPHRGD